MRGLSLILITLFLLAVTACGGANAPADEPAANEANAPVAQAEVQPAEVATSAPELPESATTEPAPTTDGGAEEPAIQDELPVTAFNGQNPDGTFFRGSATAPVTMIDYSDFLWGNCRAYVVGTEPQIVAEYVETGQLKIVYWPMIDFGPASQNAQAAAHCAGIQSPDAFWDMHDFLYAAPYGDVRGADLSYFADAAASFGLERAAFESCYNGGEGHAVVSQLDAQRKNAGIFQRPTFDINGQFIFGNQSFGVYQQAIEAALP